MSLSKHIDTHALFAHARDHPHRKFISNRRREFQSNAYTNRYEIENVPKYRIPDTGVNASAAYQLIHDEVELDGSPSLNFASFVHTWMPDEALKLVVENIAKNFSDQDEYPATMQIHSRCISMLSHLWKAPKGSHVIGTATGGSSEAIMLGGLAMKKAWVERRKAAGKDYYHPNVIMGANAQVAIEKFARYFDVEAKLVPVTEEGGYVMSPKDAIKYVDENTIGVFIILGSTYTGGFEDVQEMNDLLDKYEAETGISIPIHVDAASGGFVAPFVYPGYKWGFDVPRVHSINTSGHKFGLTYVGLGWILWKDESLLHKDLIFELHYLGSTEQSYTLNFSRPSAPILAQMFNFLNLGFAGYKNIAEADLANARLLSRALEESGWYKCLSNIHIPYKKSSITGAIGSVIGDPSGRVDEDKAAFYQRGLPVVAFRFSDEFKQNYPHVQQSWIQNLLRQKQWIVPNYNMPPNVEKVEVLRIVVRESMNPDIIERVAADILEITEQLTKTDSGVFQMQLAFSSSNLSPNTIEHEIGKFKAESDAPREQQTYSRIC
ncbi:glutamate decarboxylase [Cantharellus anzutake]|uniref:glutamate decarboxylase n=1 Tax=Cantharellus anzutake TaxID=1750568 RepID=UPI001907C40A|nr:glutamate decarboxylase [Cantharellus anzutake]KAF8328269.1 glutamate decarboxylase [Cantharellus anzutake]